jgi:hypothetical protein
MTSYHTAFAAFSNAIKDPSDANKLDAAKNHPRLKQMLEGFTQADLEVLNKVAAAGQARGCVCNDSGTTGRRLTASRKRTAARKGAGRKRKGSTRR